MKVVYNGCFGGFGLSDEAVKWIKDHNDEYGVLTEEQIKFLGKKDSLRYWDTIHSIPRHSKMLVDCVETLGSDAVSGYCSQLEIVEIKGDRYKIFEHDGSEEIITPEDDDWIVAS